MANPQVGNLAQNQTPTFKHRFDVCQENSVFPSEFLSLADKALSCIDACLEIFSEQFINPEAAPFPDSINANFIRSMNLEVRDVKVILEAFSKLYIEEIAFETDDQLIVENATSENDAQIIQASENLSDHP